MLGEDWREAYIDFIPDQKLPAGVDARSTEAARVMRRSKGFVLVDSKLYQHGARSGVLMKCVTKEDGHDILRDIHEGVCGNHAASRTLVGKAYRAGFWWPTAVTDAEDLVRRCQNCQFFGKAISCPGSQSHHHTTILAICLLEPRYDWALHNNGRRFHPCIGSYRQVYQVDRVQADSQAHASRRDDSQPHRPRWAATENKKDVEE
jgi:hypothetical protein